MNQVTALSRLILVPLLATGTILCHAVELISPDEVSQSLNVMMVEADLTAPDPLGPQIQVLDPDSLDTPLKNPFKMEVIFKPIGGSSLDFSSFKAFYGALKLDITDRLLKHAVKTSTGFRLANVDIPSGKHKIFITIKDSLGHSSAKEIAFRME